MAQAAFDGGDVSLRPDERGYVAETLARREVSAAQQFAAQGFRVFLPQMIKTARHARRLRAVRVVVFPGYLFVALDLARDCWRSVNGTYNVSRLIMGQELPMPATRGVVEALVTYRDAGGSCRFDSDLKQCDAVRVIAGPFAQVLEKIASLDGRDARGCCWRLLAAP